MNPTLILAPLRGLTDATFRSVYSSYFSGFDYAVAPFISTYQGNTIKPSLLKDLLPENNRKLKIIPQILSKLPENFLNIAPMLADLGYGTVNWNLGCPYPMVAKKTRGSGLLPHPDKISHFLDKVQQGPVSLSIKTRLGRKQPDEILELIPIFNQFPIADITIHPRTGIQMYKGKADLETFGVCLELSKHPVIYNGDINSINDFNMMAEKFPAVSAWMIGRGALANPFLPGSIKQLAPNENKMEILASFHDTLFQSYCEKLSGPGHILGRMKGIWFYLSHSFTHGRKILKKIQKSTRIEQYTYIVKSIWESEHIAPEVKYRPR
jgi:tRNA-dihydrouridine synthase